uniref:sodium- and chloride-dependent betaine transporter-like n=1 Tax=Styela clava TaxID=7725 RepID=UPI0019399F01|nr:sodium- and chloride-dependent betaine transporter-like [Styela clava]
MDTKETQEFVEKKKTENESSTRITWNRPLEFLLNVIGYNVGLGNVWRFSYLCYKNGGGAFLIPYLLVAGFCGLPLLFQEVALGQFTKHSCFGAWDLVPLMKGIGISGLLLSWYFLSYIMVVMAWVVFYIVHSFTTGPLPWSTCDNDWNTDSCRPSIILNDSKNLNTSLLNVTSANTTTSTEEFWNNYVLRRTEGIHDMGTFTNWRMILCFAFSWIVCYLCVLKGIRTTGKVAYVTVIAPYIMMFVLLIRGATLEGAGTGVLFYITPRLDKLADPNVWLDAGGQVLYSLAVCFAVLYGLGSYNKFNTNCYKHAYMCVSACCGTSVFVGFIIFCFVGHMAFEQNKNISDVAEGGPGLVFEVFPAGLTLLPLPQLWSVIFFITLLFFAIDSAFGSIEGCAALLEDFRPQWIERYGPQFGRVVVSLFPLFLGIPMLFDGGIYVFELVNMYGSSGICILFAAFCEAVALAWIYGVDRFFDNVKSMIGYYPSSFFKYCYLYVIPAITLTIFVACCARYGPLKLGDYEYPLWANVVGWMMTISVMIGIPLVAMKELLDGKGTMKQRWERATTSRFTREKSSEDSEETSCIYEEKV